MATKASSPFRSGPRRRINLLVPVPSVYNTLKPDGSYRKATSGRRLMAPAILLMTVAVAAYLAVFHFNAPDTSVATLNAPAPSETATPAPRPDTRDTAPPHVDEKAPKPSVADQTPQIKEPSTAPEVKPGEIKQEQTTFDPLLARPVAKDAAPSPKPKGVKAAPPSGKWAIRFGLCVYKSNCDRIIEDLSRKKIEAFITEGEAEVTFYKVMVGPFPTQTHAEAAAEKFRAKKMELSPFAVDDQYYLGAASFIDPKAQNAIIGTAKSFGYRAEGVSGKEPRKVYKVYRNVTFDTKQAAEKAMRYDKEKGVACFIERQD